MSDFSDFIGLVKRLRPDQIARSENDLSSRLARVFESLGLFSILDTAGGSDARKRPDITIYLDEGAADLAGTAEIVVESKKPVEITGALTDALINSNLWEDKFIPYCAAHIT